MNDKMLIITRIKKTIEYSNKILENFPTRDIELKRRIIDGLYNLLEYCYLANYNIDKIKYQNYSLVKISMIDYYFKISYKKGILSKRKFETLANHLLEINKMITAWKNNETKKEFI